MKNRSAIIMSANLGSHDQKSSAEEKQQVFFNGQRVFIQGFFPYLTGLNFARYGLALNFFPQRRRP